jgi:hypothetical protein
MAQSARKIVWTVAGLANLATALLYRSNIPEGISDIAHHPRETVLFLAMLLTGVLCFSLLRTNATSSAKILAGFGAALLLWSLLAAPSLGFYSLGSSLLALLSAAIATRNVTTTDLLGYAVGAVAGLMGGALVLLLAP